VTDPWVAGLEAVRRSCTLDDISGGCGSFSSPTPVLPCACALTKRFCGIRRAAPTFIEGKWRGGLRLDVNMDGFDVDGREDLLAAEVIMFFSTCRAEDVRNGTAETGRREVWDETDGGE